MDVYVIHTRDNGNSAPIGVFTSLEKAEEEADSHAASVYGITKVIQITRRDDLEIRCYGEGEMHLINYLTKSRRSPRLSRRG